MSFITKHQYRSLEETEITTAAPELAELLGSDDLGVYAQYSSWAIYPNVDVKPESAAQDPSAVNTFDAVEGIAHNNVVLVAFNLGRPEDPARGAKAGKLRHDRDRMWANFHSGKRDYNIARGTEDTAFRGAYITDFFKGLPTRSIADFDVLMHTHNEEWRTRVKNAMHQVLDHELSLIGAEAASLVAFGRNKSKSTSVLKLLRDFYGDKRVCSVDHYSGAVGRNYRGQFEKLEESLNLA